MEVSCSAQPFTELPAAKDITDARTVHQQPLSHHARQVKISSIKSRHNKYNTVILWTITLCNFVNSYNLEMFIHQSISHYCTRRTHSPLWLNNHSITIIPILAFSLSNSTFLELLWGKLYFIIPTTSLHTANIFATTHSQWSTNILRNIHSNTLPTES